MSDEAGNRMLRAALAYAGLGWRVHPCRPREKLPLLKGWPSRASAEAGAIDEWWLEHPDANVAVATGPGSGIFVLDVDGPEGERALVDLEHQHGCLPDLYPMQWTGSPAVGGFRMIECGQATGYRAIDREPGTYNLPIFDHGVPPFPAGTFLSDDKLVLTAAKFCDALNQSAEVEKGPGHLAAGGELIMTKLVPGRVEQRKLRRFKDFEAVKERIPHVRSAFFAAPGPECRADAAD